MYQAASSEIFGEPIQAPQTEETPLAPLTPYGAAKAYAFIIVRSTAALRPPRILGDPLQPRIPRRPLDFLPRKVAHGAARISLGLEDALLSATSKRGATGGTRATTSARCG